MKPASKKACAVFVTTALVFFLLGMRASNQPQPCMPPAISLTKTEATTMQFLNEIKNVENLDIKFENSSKIPNQKGENLVISTKPIETTPLIGTRDWEVANRFQRRLLEMKSVCKQKNSERQKRHHIFLVDVPRRLLVCVVLKSGSSSWRKMFWSIDRKSMNLSQNQSLYTEKDTRLLAAKTSKLKREEWNKLIATAKDDSDFNRDPPKNSSFRVILARHPFARLISGWNQKFSYWSNYWVLLLKRFPKLIDYKKEIDPDRVFSFGDFARFISENQGDFTDSHFAPATQVCSPCHFNYTYVVKAETIDADERWLMERLGLSDVSLLRHGRPTDGSLAVGDVNGNIKKFMQKLSPEIIRGLYKFYKDDFEVFGYTFDFDSLEAGGWTEE